LKIDAVGNAAADRDFFEVNPDENLDDLIGIRGVMDNDDPFNPLLFYALRVISSVT
jgi:hypothetical protein